MKVKVSVPPTMCFFTTTVACLVFVKVQVIVSPFYARATFKERPERDTFTPTSELAREVTGALDVDGT